MLLGYKSGMSIDLLPYDAEVEYLESTGTQYIDTLIAPDSYTKVACTFSAQFTNRRIFGARGTANGDRQFECIAYDTREFGFIFRFSNSGNFPFKPSNFEQIFSVSMDSSGVTINGTERIAFPSANQFVAPCNLIIFGCNFNGSPGSFCLSKTYSFKIWQNGVLVRDFIPVRVGTVGYLYDRVSGKLFGNAGTGDFVLGPDVVPVEYLQSSGTQYIDTGVVGYKTTKVESHCALLNANSAYPAIWGARTGSRNNDFQIYYNTPTIGGNPSSIVLRTGNSDKSISTSDIGVNTFIGTRLDIVAADGALSVNGYNFSTPAFSNFTTPHSILMFCEYTANTPKNFGSFVYWGMKMWQADSIVRSFLPVRVGTDATSWEGAMMDTLTRRIYRNQGTGAFTYGNDLPYSILGGGYNQKQLKRDIAESEPLCEPLLYKEAA